MPIRTARAEDLPTLRAIYDAAVTLTGATCHLSPRPAEEGHAWWRAHQNPQFPILVAEEDGAVAGYAALSLWHEGVLYAQTAEASIFLAPERWGQGLGTALLRALLEEAARLDYHVIVARVWASNAASLALCRRCGFKQIGVQREVGRRPGAWEDCVILEYLIPTRAADV